jgi:hypothetical protein
MNKILSSVIAGMFAVASRAGLARAQKAEPAKPIVDTKLDAPKK